MSALITHLERLREADNRAAFAMLRRAAGKPPGTVPEVFQYVAPYVPESETGPERDWPYYLTASLYAIHPSEIAKGDFGWTMCRLGKHPSAEARFRALLGSRVSELPTLLRHAVKLAKSSKHQIPVDYELLLKHLRHWTHPDQWVQRRWASSYWASPASPATNDQQTSE